MLIRRAECGGRQDAMSDNKAYYQMSARSFWWACEACPTCLLAGETEYAHQKDVLNPPQEGLSPLEASPLHTLCSADLHFVFASSHEVKGRFDLFLV
jgi:hypothetical protein